MKDFTTERAKIFAELEISEEKIRRATAQLTEDNEKEIKNKLTALFLERITLRNRLEDLHRKEDEAKR